MFVLSFINQRIWHFSQDVLGISKEFHTSLKIKPGNKNSYIHAVLNKSIDKERNYERNNSAK